MATGSATTHRSRGGPIGLALAAGMIALLLAPALAGPATLPPPPGVTCNPKNPSPSALAIPAKNPARAKAGDILNVSFEYRVLNYTKAEHGTLLYLPSVEAVYPESPSGSLKVFFPSQTVAVANGLWSSTSGRSASTTLATTPTFASGSSAYLTTSKFAIMATALTGSLTFAVRWHYSIFHHATGNTTGISWTVPTRSSTGSFLPSIFYPASYVGLVGTSGSPVKSGSTYVVDLNGTVSNTWFRMVLEYPNNGTEIQSIYENSTGVVPQFNATLPVAYRNGTGVPGGTYLIHVHDSCQAIVHSFSFVAN